VRRRRDVVVPVIDQRIFLRISVTRRNAAPQGHGLALVIRDDVVGISCVRAYARAFDVTLDDSMTFLMMTIVDR